MAFLDREYLGRLSFRLDKFTLKNFSPYHANFRCPYCGDSKKDKNKTRGYFYTKDAKIFFTCHNCGVNRTARQFIREFDPCLYDEYVMERIKYSAGEKPKPKYEPVVEEPPEYGDIVKFNIIPRISDLTRTHEARRYLDSRLIPDDMYDRLYYTKNFTSFVNKMIPDKIAQDGHTDARIVIPFLGKGGTLYGFQGRSLRTGGNVLRYITIMMHERAPKLFGLDRFDVSKDGYIVEGPFDSMFLPNALAMGGSSLNAKTFAGLGLSPAKTTMVYDNEPRNKEIVRRVSNAITHGFKVCIWPKRWTCKDINQGVIEGYSPRAIKEIIDENTFSGLQAQIKFTEWKV